ncbi:MAG: hypothetical protein HOP19_23320 [Acidobacteria bacterium]|nr:hypothetical protein [Acidobacteriota bacterium]
MEPTEERERPQPPKPTGVQIVDALLAGLKPEVSGPLAQVFGLIIDRGYFIWFCLFSLLAFTIYRLPVGAWDKIVTALIEKGRWWGWLGYGFALLFGFIAWLQNSLTRADAKWITEKKEEWKASAKLYQEIALQERAERAALEQYLRFSDPVLLQTFKSSMTLPAGKNDGEKRLPPVPPSPQVPSGR